MKNYLSFGGGVNSVAMHLMLLDMEMEFEAVFVDHGADWPETYEYLDLFQHWLADNGFRKITVLKPDARGYQELYAYCWDNRITPSRQRRWCTDMFKVRVIHEYIDTQCFMMLGIDAGESHRARMSSKNGVENRYPLIEEGINRESCRQIIREHGLPDPGKSGCWFCPFQRVSQWKKLRREHPDLFCMALQLERRASSYRIERGKTPITISYRPLDEMINDRQLVLFPEAEYPPCQCVL